MKSIQTKFILLILGCVLMTCAVLGSAGVMNAKRAVDHDSAQIMNLICSEKEDEMNSLLSRIQQSVETLAFYTLDQLESADSLRDRAYEEEFTQSLERIAVNTAENTAGAMAVYIRYNPEFTESTSGLFWSRQSENGRFQQLPPTDLSNYPATDTEHVGWYYIPVERGKATWIEPYLNRNLQVRMISYVIPLYKNSEIVGVVGMDIDFSVISDSIDRMQIYDSGYAFLLHNNGDIVYHPDIPMGTALVSVDRNLVGMLNELASGASGKALFPYVYKGQQKKMAFRSLENEMILVVTAPVKEIDAVKNELIAQILVAMVFISSFSILVTILLTRRMVRPLKELNEAARKIADGDLSISISCNTRDEVGTLAESFRITAEHLQKYITYINGIAYRDSLTGVKNKTAYKEATERLEQEMRVGCPEYAVVVFDINNLKQINDTCGHDIGDMAIRDVCKIICRVFCHSPIYRIGGDEFVAILENSDLEHCMELMDEFVNTLDEINRVSRSDTVLLAAKGIAVYNYETDLVFADVFKRADEAMYKNKAVMKQQ